MKSNEFKGILDDLEQGKPGSMCRELEGKKYIRKFAPEERLILLGGGHIAQPLCKIAALLDFSVAVVDDRPSFANTSRFPEASKVICDAFTRGIAQLHIRTTDYVCVITRGHRWDGECLRELLRGTMPSYLGMIGSSRRVAGLLGVLAEEGFDTKALSAIHAPIGLKINALTPAEIAVSICGELVAHRRQRPQEDAGAVLAQTSSDLSLLRFLAESEEPKALMLVLSSTGSTPVKSGAIMAVNRLGQGYGTIGGGCSEAAVLGKARQLIGTGESCVVEVDMTNDIAEEEGMVCGGTMRVLIEDV